MKEFFVYIMTNKHHTVLYTGVTAYLHIRSPQHKFKLTEGFTKQYNVTKMVFVRFFPSALEAIGAEKRTKGWSRKKKIALINSVNPGWKDVMSAEGEIDLEILSDKGFGPTEKLSVGSEKWRRGDEKEASRKVVQGTVQKEKARHDGFGEKVTLKKNG